MGDSEGGIVRVGDNKGDDKGKGASRGDGNRKGTGNKSRRGETEKVLSQGLQ